MKNYILQDFIIWLKEWNGVIGNILIPIIGVIGIPIYLSYKSRKDQELKSKQDAKLNLYLDLRANAYRKSESITWVESLNKIDVLFYDEPKILKAWEDYFESLPEEFTTIEQVEKSNEKCDKLLNSIAAVLGYIPVNDSAKLKVYRPKAYANYLNRIEVADNLSRNLLSSLLQLVQLNTPKENNDKNHLRNDDKNHNQDS